MNNSREIKSRIKSVGNIFKVTKAMGAIAASRMRKAQIQTFNARPYIQRSMEILAFLRFYGFHAEQFPLISEREVKKIGVFLITPDRGLSGALIPNLLKTTLNFKQDEEKKGKKLSFIVIGKKGESFLKRVKAEILAVFPDKAVWKLADVSPIHKLIMSSFLAGEFDLVTVIYSNFISPLRQEAIVRPILPLTQNNLEKLLETRQLDEILHKTKYPLLYQVEPKVDIIIKELIPHLIKTGLYYLFLETKASEYSARMLAMENARKNADELIKDLVFSYNQIRQASITSQIAEIVGGKIAMEE